MIDAGVLSEDEKIELVEGEIVVMAAKGYAHEIIKTALVTAFIQAAPADVTIGVEMTTQFSSESLLEPDIAVSATSKLLKSDANFVSVEHGGCSLALEVAGSSLRYDKAERRSSMRASAFRSFGSSMRMSASPGSTPALLGTTGRLLSSTIRARR
ncbi:MAG TPA: Uma2 family endonuclease [Xanthobacteraceae bacterium]